ncbi:MAG TPA: hypothetical protein VIV11_15780 [Kofleriaceae bacterium]
MPRTVAALTVIALALPSHSSFADDTFIAFPPNVATPYPDCAQLAGGGVVGRRNCPPYGMWGAAREAPYITVGLGVNFRRLPRRFAASTSSSTSSLARTTGAATITEPGTDTSYTIVESIDLALTSFSYVGLEIEISPSMPEHLAPGARTFAAGAQAVLGLRGGNRHLKLGVELAGGGRVIDSTGNYDADEPVLEARAFGDLWVTPWFTVGALVGASVIDRGDWVTGVQLGFHSWSYGGL